MKRTLSLILAALLLASSLAACGKTEPDETTGGTTAVESNVPATDPVATNAPATDPAETEAPTLSYDSKLLVENGMAKAHIVLSENANELEKIGAEELAYHIKKVSNAEIPTTNTVQSDSLPIVIATPDSLPELETLFPEDLSWLRELGEVGDTERYGDDGFAIREANGTLYIFGATAKGALNGVYDFIEENMGVLWIRADEEIGLIYDEMPTITAEKVNYREKSPFAARGWHHCAKTNHQELSTRRMLSRNKINCTSAGGYPGITCLYVAHNVKQLITSSPLYDPNITEYWNTDEKGNPLDASESPQINFWSDLAAEAMAATLIQTIRTTGDPVVFVGIEDVDEGCIVYGKSSEPFEYAEGQFVYPSDSNFKSTVYFTFLNKVARMVEAEVPGSTVRTFAYFFTRFAPACTLEDNIEVVQATIYEDLRYDINDPTSEENKMDFKNLESWKEISNNQIFYNYYGCFVSSPLYCRPIWYRIQSDLQYYASCGFLGVQPEGLADDSGDYMWDILADPMAYIIKLSWSVADFTNADTWATNALTYWLYGKLAWNPYEDVDALIEYFCEKVYGNAAEPMLEYYNLLYKGWVDGSAAMDEEYLQPYGYGTSPMVHYEFFVNYDSSIRDGLLNALTTAYDTAEGSAKVLIGQMKALFEKYVEIYDW